MFYLSYVIAAAAIFSSVFSQSCPDYTDYSGQPHAPFSSGRYNLSYQRPSYGCRTFHSAAVDNLISNYSSVIKDPDLYRLFQNSFPNTLDTTIKWKGFASGTDEELSFVITGDIDAMWLRDSANQMQSYVSLVKQSTANDSLASLYRGVINIQARYLLEYPYCQSFQPPVESGLPPSQNGAASDDTVTPPYNNQSVFECKFELDSFAAFLEISNNYYTATGDHAFFGKYQWLNALNTILSVAQAQMVTTYAPNGSVNTYTYTFERDTPSGEDTLDNSGAGNPTGAGTGLIRSDFRPSDDACIYQLFIPGNMMFARYLNSTAKIVQKLGNNTALANKMLSLSSSLRSAIDSLGTFTARSSGEKTYAYEIDGFESVNFMDDANIPSLLAAPFYGYLSADDPVYQATRDLVLSDRNPYFMRGPVLTAVGGPHDGPGYAWPMASIVRILTSDNDTEITGELKQLVSSTDGLGLIHESINTFDASDYSRPWFAWVNGLFGQMIVDLANRKPEILQQSFQ